MSDISANSDRRAFSLLREPVNPLFGCTEAGGTGHYLARTRDLSNRQPLFPLVPPNVLVHIFRNSTEGIVRMGTSTSIEYKSTKFRIDA
jgi:hypothetical protein